jgi:hypothetical protein
MTLRLSIWDVFLPRRGYMTQPRVSTRFQPWESSNETIRPEGAQAHVHQLQTYIYFCCHTPPGAPSGRIAMDGPFPGLKSRAKSTRPLRGEESSKTVLSLAPMGPFGKFSASKGLPDSAQRFNPIGANWPVSGFFCPEGSTGLSPGFQPWESSHEMIRPEGAQVHVHQWQTYIYFCCHTRSGAHSGRIAADGPFPGLKPRAKSQRPLRGEESSKTVLSFAPRGFQKPSVSTLLRQAYDCLGSLHPGRGYRTQPRVSTLGIIP